MGTYSKICYDFHSHTNYSDGVLSPVKLAQRASDRDVALLAISDHDSISGLEEAERYCRENNIQVKIIPAIEISSQSDFGEIHIVGLGIDPINAQLKAKILLQQQRRWDRVEVMEVKFRALGIEGVLDSVKAGCKEVVTRTHIARSLVELGFAKDSNQAFKKYIGKKGRVKVKSEWLSMAESIELIQQAGGLAVLAHPTRYPMSNRRLSYLIEEFKLAGGDGIEMAYPSLSPDKRGWLEVQRGKNDLLASGGSDFHYPDLKWSDLGYFPKIPDGIPHVLDILVDRLQLNLSS